MMDDRSWEVPVVPVVGPVVPVGEPFGGFPMLTAEDAALCGTRFHGFGCGPDWRCGLPRGHEGPHVANVAHGGWYDLPAGAQLGDEGTTAGVAHAHMIFEKIMPAPQLPELVASPHAARCVLDMAGEREHQGYAGEWARQLLLFLFQCDPQNRAQMALAFPSWVAAVWLYERDPTQLRTVATMQEGTAPS